MLNAVRQCASFPERVYVERFLFSSEASAEFHGAFQCIEFVFQQNDASAETEPLFYDAFVEGERLVEICIGGECAELRSGAAESVDAPDFKLAVCMKSELCECGGGAAPILEGF